jgi:hypothetical protein
LLPLEHPRETADIIDNFVHQIISAQSSSALENALYA